MKYREYTICPNCGSMTPEPSPQTVLKGVQGVYSQTKRLLTALPHQAGNFIFGAVFAALIMLPAYANAGGYCDLPIKIGQLSFIGSGHWEQFKARVVGYHTNNEGDCEYAVRVHPGPNYYVNEKYLYVRAGNLSPISVPEPKKACTP